MAPSKRYLCWIAIFCLLLNAHHACAAKKTRKRDKPRRKIDQLEGPTDTPVWELGLDARDLSYADMLEKSQQYWSNTAAKNFPNAVLGYVTPWNKAGHWAAETFKAKFTHISPVWYQLKYEHNQFQLTGGHDVNSTWIRQLQQPGPDGAPGSKVLPRVIFEMEPQGHLQVLMQAQTVVELLLKECDMHGYDGLTIETWMQWQLFNALEDEQFRAAAIAFISFLSSELQQAGRQVALVVVPALPGHYRAPHFAVEHFEQLRQHVDWFSVMTYDWQGPDPGSNANAPYDWLHQNLQLLLPSEEDRMRWGPKVLLGLNFYGYDYELRAGRKGAVMGQEVLQLMAKHGAELRWHEQHQEHFFEYGAKGGRHVVWYPTPGSIQLRLQLAREFNVGVAIWELGQGLPWFNDLL